MGPLRTPLPGSRWHLVHGPIDLVIGADGDGAALRAAHEAAWSRFGTVLAELVAELPLLRQPLSDTAWSAACPLRGPVARRMWQACAALPTAFITPMAAVAGAVAEEIVAAYRRPGIERAWVNNGGDVALHLAAGASLRIGVVADIAQHARSGAANPALDARLRVAHDDPVRGIATSGWRGRSFSLGIADSVTVLAPTAAQADAAATVIANAVDLDDPAIGRAPASSLKDDSDLGERLVTVAVPPLAPARCLQALQRGLAVARELQRLGHVHDAALFCQGQSLTLGAALRLPQAA